MIKPILAIETSAKNCGIALYFSDSNFYEQNEPEQRSHSQIIFSLIENCFKNADRKISDCESIAVSIGPGSFTGLRIGLSAAKGIAFGAGLPIISVPTFEAAAWEIYSTFPSHQNFIVASRVNTEEVYKQKFIATESEVQLEEELKIIPLEELKMIDNSIPIFTELDLKERGNYHYFSSPSSVSIAKWAMRFGGQKKVFDFDSLEPDYFKDFVIKRKMK